MKSIKITEKIKNENQHVDFIKNANVGDIVYGYVPDAFKGDNFILGGYRSRLDLQETDGWKTPIKPQFDSRTQKLSSEIFELNDEHRYDIVDKTIEEIQNDILSQSELHKEYKVKTSAEAIALNELMNETDIPAILENIDVYPLWQFGLYVVNKTDSPNGIPDRFKHFNAVNELTLYEVIQSHTTQSDWQPKDTPALFKVVAPDGVIPVFRQPTGAHDAYQIGDQVHFPTASDPIYESLINGNTYSPTAYAAGWKTV